MEILDLYDINRQKLPDQIMIRDQYQPKDTYRIACGVVIFNSQGQMLIQKRHQDKILFPGMWDISAAGSVISGESSQMAIERELKEELGLSVDFSNIRPKLTTHFPAGFCDFYTLELDVDLDELTLQKEEVTAVKWASLAEINQMIFAQEFIPYFSDFINLIAVMAKKHDLYYSED